MWAKFLLTALALLMIAFAIRFDPSRSRSLLGSGPHDGPHLRLLTWNLGYAQMEDDSRAHTKDLRAVADTILRNDPDAVALQELTGPEQLNTLLGYLHKRYKGAIAPAGDGDRVDAVLVKGEGGRFEHFTTEKKYAVAATLHLPKSAEIVFVSAHADAFKAERRRVFVGDLVDWARARPSGALVFIGGDFNFELNAKTITPVHRQRKA
jgi:endonuclease/exonuclease/phosphatase family metal-dependent hydrolase